MTSADRPTVRITETEQKRITPLPGDIFRVEVKHLQRQLRLAERRVESRDVEIAALRNRRREILSENEALRARLRAAEGGEL